MIRMDRRTALVSAAAAALTQATIVKAQERKTMPQGKFAEVNGLKLYYEVHGAGRPLVLLHGGGPEVGAFAPSLPLFSQGRKAIVVHLQGHGHTKDIDRPFRYETMADDVAALIAALGFPKVDVLGYSLGGGVALQLAIRHPDRVDRLVCVSTTMKHDGSYPEVIAAFDHMEASAPMIAGHLRQSPLAALYPDVDWETLFRKMGDMNKRPFDWSAEVAGIKARSMLVFADADSVLPTHMMEFWQAIGGGRGDAGIDGSRRPQGRLAVLPGTTHYTILADTTVARAVIPFLDQA